MSTLVNKNIIVAGHRTSMRLEPEMWDALSEICVREKCGMRDICTLIDASRGSTSLTSAVRVFILAYFRFAVANSNTTEVSINGGVGTNGSGNNSNPPDLSSIVTRIFNHSPLASNS